jgi:Txe/YoeB family toxin of Txe-Axe toxin-antitoxin module
LKIKKIHEFIDNEDLFNEEDWNEKDSETWEEKYLNKSYFYITFRINGIKINKSILEKSRNSLIIKDYTSGEIIGVIMGYDDIIRLRMSHPDDYFIFEIQMLIPTSKEDEFIKKIESLKSKAIDYYKRRMQKDENNKVLKNSFIKTLSLDPKKYI